MVQIVQLQWLLGLKSNLDYFLIHNFNVICWKVNELNGKHKHENVSNAKWLLVGE
jgi:hypothetical protein